MQYTRVLIAKVALGVATEDEVFWVKQCIEQGCSCEKEIVNLRALGGLPRSLLCGDDLALIHMADHNKLPAMGQAEEHLLSCQRCARLGQYIANMQHPSVPADTRPLQLVG